MQPTAKEAEPLQAPPFEFPILILTDPRQLLRFVYLHLHMNTSPGFSTPSQSVPSQTPFAKLPLSKPTEK